MMTHEKTVRPIFFKLLSLSLIIFGGVWAAKHQPAKAGNLQDVSVTLSNSRFSFEGTATAATTSDTMIDIAEPIGVGWVDGDDQATDPLVVGDTLTFPDEAVTTRTIQEIVDADTIIINDSLTATSRSFSLDQKSTLTISLTTQTYIAGDDTTSGGYFRVLVPAADSNNSDGDPDPGKFDADDDSASITCTGTNHVFTSGATGTNTGNSYYDSDYYHEYYCAYSGGDNNETVTITIDDIINPAPSASHDSGTAETYGIYVEHVDGSTSTVVDSTLVKVGAIEAVQVKAEVVPSLTFRIYGVTDSAINTNSICGLSTGDGLISTGTDLVSFTSLSTGSFSHGAQKLYISTNAADGATVTVQANDQLGLNGNACDGDTHNSGTDAYECIWDANVTSMTHTTEQDWTSTSDTGFAYSLDDGGDGTDDCNEAFDYNGAADTDDFNARHFPDGSETSPEQSAEEIFDTNSDPVNAAELYVCYRIIPDALTAAGDYYNYITYTATPQF